MREKKNFKFQKYVKRKKTNKFKGLILKSTMVNNSSGYALPVISYLKTCSAFIIYRLLDKTSPCPDKFFFHRS